MNPITKNTVMTMISQVNTIYQYLSKLLLSGLLLSVLSCSQSSPPHTELVIDSALDQAVFATPENAARTFTLALSTDDLELLKKILGTHFQEVLPLDELTDADVIAFIDAWKVAHTLLPQGAQKRFIAVGEGQWTLPIPIIAGTSGWYFDIQEGLKRMRIRRIGRNELAAMQTVLAYYDAQMEYAEQFHDKHGTLSYAQKFISTPDTHDGLYWKTASNEPLSPLGPLLADRTPGGGYHGYFYKILKAQGASAQGGAYSYLRGKHMQAGFALIAWPEEYGESGIMSFLISHEGIVYEQDLGKNSASIAQQTSTYNPDSGWRATKDVYTTQLNSKP